MAEIVDPFQEVDAPQPPHRKSYFEAELRALINIQSLEGGSNTPDYILATYMMACLDAFEVAVKSRDFWYGTEQTIGRIAGLTQLHAKP